MSIEIDVRNLAKWLNEEQLAPIDKQALARVLAHVQTAEQQEPVAWMDIDENGTFSGLRYWSEQDNRNEVALYTSTPANRSWVNPSIKEYEDIMMANMTPRTSDERDAIMGALADMVVLLEEKNA